MVSKCETEQPTNQLRISTLYLQEVTAVQKKTARHASPIKQHHGFFHNFNINVNFVTFGKAAWFPTS